MQVRNLMKFMTGFGVLGLVIGIIYSLMTSKIYKVNASAAILRMNISQIERDLPEAKNRWVWVREGLALKNALLSDDIIKEFVENNDVLQKRKTAYVQDVAKYYPKLEEGDLSLIFYERLKKNISIAYEGGDANIFHIEVKDKSPLVSKNLADYLLEKLKFLAKKRSLTPSEKQIRYVNNRIKEMKKKRKRKAIFKISHDRLIQAYGKLFVEKTIAEMQQDNIFEVIEYPRYPLQPYWPKIVPVIIATTLLGSLAGWGVFVLLGGVSAKDGD